MRKSFKKGLALLMSAALALGAPVAVGTDTAKAAEVEADASGVATLNGVAWWDAANDSTKNYTVGASLVNYIMPAANDMPFSMEVWQGKLETEGGIFLTTDTNKNAWWASTTKPEGAADPTVTKGDATVVKGHIYRVTTTTTADSVKIECFDETDNKAFSTVEATVNPFGDTALFHIQCQTGTMYVADDKAALEKVELPVDPEPTAPAASDGAVSGDTSAQNAPGTDFSKIEKQPVVKYTFDNATDVDLTGSKATVENGILNLATEAGHHQEYYAKIDDLSSYDFSKGFTWTADVKVDAWPSGDWTGIITLGDGELGKGIDNGTVGYHYTIGLSSILDYNKSGTMGKVGYMGGGQFFNDNVGPMVAGVALPDAPYVYNWYSFETSQKKWDTIAVTIDADNKMATYINGVEIQRYTDAAIAEILAALKSAKNNYLGTGYWSGDDDFIGAMDNVGIYDTALSADEIKSLTSATANNDAPSGDTSGGTQSGKKSITIADAAYKSGKVTGTLNAENATVKVQVGDAEAKDATVSGKTFTFDAGTVKAGTAIKITATAEGYMSASKTITVSAAKKTIKLSSVKAKGKKVTGKVSVAKATVKVKVGKAAYKKAKVSGKKFTLKTKKMKKGTKVIVKATKSGCKAAKKTVKAK